MVLEAFSTCEFVHKYWGINAACPSPATFLQSWPPLFVLLVRAQALPLLLPSFAAGRPDPTVSVFPWSQATETVQMSVVHWSDAASLVVFFSVHHPCFFEPLLGMMLPAISLPAALVG